MNKGKFKGRYRTTSTSLKSWDYGWNAAYFVTICTKDKRFYFGHITESSSSGNGERSPHKMELSRIGHIATECWLNIPDHYPFIKLGNHIIMPNHLHGIVIIEKKDQSGVNLQKTANRFGPQSQNLSSVIRGFKSGVTKNARQIYADFTWQPGFYDHIIRNDASFEQISAYIENNVQHWREDKYYL